MTPKVLPKLVTFVPPLASGRGLARFSVRVLEPLPDVVIGPVPCIVNELPEMGEPEFPVIVIEVIPGDWNTGAEAVPLEVRTYPAVPLTVAN